VEKEKGGSADEAFGDGSGNQVCCQQKHLLSNPGSSFARVNDPGNFPSPLAFPKVWETKKKKSLEKESIKKKKKKTGKGLDVSNPQGEMWGEPYSGASKKKTKASVSVVYSHLRHRSSENRQPNRGNGIRKKVPGAKRGGLGKSQPSGKFLPFNKIDSVTTSMLVDLCGGRLQQMGETQTRTNK